MVASFSFSLTSVLAKIWMMPVRSLFSPLRSPSPLLRAGALRGPIGGVVRGAGSSLSRGLGLWLGLALVLCFGLLPLASGSIQLPVCRGILLLLFLVSRVAVVILIFGLGLLLRVSRSFGILLLLLFLSSGGVLCPRGLLLGRSLGRGHGLVFFLPVLLSGLRSSISGAIAAGNLDLLIGAVS